MITVFVAVVVVVVWAGLGGLAGLGEARLAVTWDRVDAVALTTCDTAPTVS